MFLSPMTAFSDVFIFKKRDYCPPGRNDDKPARRISSTRSKFVAIVVLECINCFLTR